MQELESLRKQLEKPFPVDEIYWKPQVVRNGAGLAVIYLDARAACSRLDEVFPLAWEDSYKVLSDTPERTVVECSISITVPGGSVVTRRDVGESDNDISEGSKEASRWKSAVSDSFKRAAVKFGVGAYLYHLVKPWAPYDESKKIWTEEGLKYLKECYLAELEGKPSGKSPGARGGTGNSGEARITNKQVDFFNSLCRSAGVEAEEYLKAHDYATREAIPQAEFNTLVEELKSAALKRRALEDEPNKLPV